MNIIDLVIKHFDKIAGAILFCVFAGYIAYRNYQKNRLADACIKFRNEVTTALENIYPAVSVYMKADDINTKILESIPKIVTAATAYRHHLPFYRKSGFDKATQNYGAIARDTDWNEHMAYLQFPNTYKDENVRPGNKFRQAVDRVLSYAKEK